MSAPLRIVIGLGALGSVGGGAYLLHQQLSTDNIQKRLEANKFQILEKSSDDWDAILKSYKDTVSIEENAKLKFDNFDGNGDNAKETLQEKCKKTLIESPSNKEAYEKAAKWCTVPKTLASVLEEEGYSPLSTNTGDDNKHKAEWEGKLTEHIKDSYGDKRFADEHISKVAPVKKEKANIDAIKNKCKTLNDKKHHDKDFDSDLEKAKLWCAIEKTKNNSLN